jgi:hypothetical protein
MPGGVEELVVREAVVIAPLQPTLTGFGENVAVVPAGKPATASVTVWVPPVS